MNLQHLNFKIYTDKLEAKPEEFNAVFQTWIQQNLCEELLIDVADYLHVPAGPGMLLVGLEADYSLDQTDNRWGLRYNRKAILNGSNQDRMTQALKSTLEACQRLELDERLQDKLKFKTNELELFVNDRALAPNTPATLEAVKPELEAFFQKVFNGQGFQLSHHQDPRARFGVTVKTPSSQNIEALLKNLGYTD